MTDGAVMRGGLVAIRPVEPNDYGWVVQVVGSSTPNSEGISGRGGLNSGNPLQRLWNSSLSVLLVADEANGIRLGVMALKMADPSGRTAELQIWVDASFVVDSEIVEGVRLFVDYAFTGWDWRKLYYRGTSDSATVPIVMAALIDGEGKSAVEVEGCLREHLVREGSLVDLLILAIDRDRWEGCPDLICRGGGSAS